MKIADRIQAIEESKSIGLSAQVEKLRAEGKSIIALNIGEADFATPQPIIEATQKALDLQKTRYSAVPGIADLRKAIAQKISSEENVDVKAENIIVGHGSKSLLYSLFQTICNPGDEVIIPKPYWVTFPEIVKLAGAKPILVDSLPDFQLDLAKIEKAISPRTKAILYNSPNNPTGAVYPEADQVELLKLAHKHEFFLISDEAYRDLVYDKLEPKSLIAIHGSIDPYLVSVQTFSKSYCMTGFRLGHLVAHPTLIQAMNKLNGHLTGNPSTFAQYGAVMALNMDQNLLKNMHQQFEERRNLAHQLSEEIFPCPKPQGAFYVFPNIEKYLGGDIANCTQLAEYILREAHVAILPGDAFGQEGHLRISFAASEAEIRQAFKQIKDALMKLKA